MSEGYLRSPSAFYKLVQIAFNLIGAICIFATFFSSRGDAFLVATMGGTIISLALFLMQITGCNDSYLSALPWVIIEIVYNIIWAIFLLVTASLVIEVKSDGYIAGGIFGLFSAATHAIDAYKTFRK